VIDELGKMELASEASRAAVCRLLEQHVALVATVHVARHPFTDALKRRPAVELVRVTAQTRDERPARLVTRLAAHVGVVLDAEAEVGVERRCFDGGSGLEPPASGDPLAQRVLRHYHRLRERESKRRPTTDILAKGRGMRRPNRAGLDTAY
jgi:NTP hydrolase family protein